MFVRYRAVNPLLGVYYGIFTAAFVGLGIILLILEYMGLIAGHLTYALCAAAFFLSGVIAVASATKVLDEFFVSGRRVPSGLNGLVIMITALGGAGLSGLVGALFFFGVDGFSYLLGVLGGVLLAGVLFAAFVRKAGSFTLPTFFETRYQSRLVGALCGLALFIPTVCFALAELSIITMVGPFVFGLSESFCAVVAGGVVLVMVLPGGVRSMSWAQCALAIVVILGLLVPLILLAIDYTNLPLAQFTYGSLIDDIAKFETLNKPEQVVGGAKGGLALLNGEAHFISYAFLGGERPFDVIEKVAIFLLIVAGVGAMPALLLRAGVSVNAFQARKSYAWGAALVGVIVLTIPAYVIFFRYLIFDPQVKILADALPVWMESLKTMGLIAPKDVNGDGAITPSEIRLARDGVFIGLPMLAGFNQTMQSVTFAALFAGAMASLMARVMVLGQVLVCDLTFRKKSMEADVIGRRTLIWVRLALIFVVGGLILLVLTRSFDPFQMFVAGLVFCALGLFPVMVLSIWWNGMNKAGLVIGLGAGFCSAFWVLYGAQFGGGALTMGMSLFHMGAVCLAGVFVLTFVAAKIGRFGKGADREALNEIRTPGGEALYDRVLRLAMPRRSGSTG